VYDELCETWRKEKENDDVQILSKDFFSRLTQYVKRLKEESRMLDEKTARGRLIAQETKNAKRLSEELILLRLEKLVKKTMAGKQIAKEALTEKEEKVHGEISASVEAHQNFLKGVLSGNQSRFEVKVEEKKKRIVRFLREVPTIIGTDMKMYGPFKPEDVASLPVENARTLVKQELAVEIEIKI
jgi:DNA replication factor GINS